MRYQLIKEYKLPFIERTKTGSPDFAESWSQQLIIDHFDEPLAEERVVIDDEYAPFLHGSLSILRFRIECLGNNHGINLSYL